MIRFSSFLILLVLLSSCGRGKKTNATSPENKGIDVSVSKKTASVNDFALVETVKKFIYYMNEVDISTYDSISTQYFHEVVDYTDTIAISIDNKLKKLKLLINGDSLNSFEKEVVKDEMIQLSTELSKYSKSVTGYLFVHTFLNKGDTLSAIIITNADMSKGEAFPVNTVNHIEPSQFTENIRQIAE